MKHIQVATEIARKICAEFTPQEQNEILQKIHAFLQETREQQLREAENQYLTLKESMKGLNP